MMMKPNSLTVAVLGASDRPDRYSFQAIEMLLESGHTVFPVTTKRISLRSLTVYRSVTEVPRPLHTITLYVNPSILETLVDEILEVRPIRVIFNPGTENPAVERRLQEAGIQVVEACTLVLLRTGQFID
jgi:predicted CoA-binding protein